MKKKFKVDVIPAHTQVSRRDIYISQKINHIYKYNFNLIMIPVISFSRWNDLKEVRNVSNFLYVHTEVFEKKLIGRCIFKNDEVSSAEALKDMNKALLNGAFVFKSFGI